MTTDNVEYIGVSELAAAVGEALSEIAEVDRRMKSGATEIPTERTIRFYLEKGLLPKPSKRLGQTLVFGRIHLLYLLVIKKLQADGVPLSGIPDILKKKGKTEAQLEELLKEEVQIFRSRRSLDEFRERTGHTDDSDVFDWFAQAAAPMQQFSDEPPAQRPPAEGTPASEAKSYLKSLLSRSARRPAQQMPGEAEEPEIEVLYSLAPPSPARWTRHQPAPGVEINIHDDYEPPTDEKEKARLLEKLRKILGL